MPTTSKKWSSVLLGRPIQFSLFPVVPFVALDNRMNLRRTVLPPRMLRFLRWRPGKTNGVARRRIHEQGREMSTTPSTNDATRQSDRGTDALPFECKRVLLVEDSPDQQRLYAKFLQLAGAEVTLECSGEAAVDAVATASRDFHAIVIPTRRRNSVRKTSMRFTPVGVQLAEWKALV